VRIAILSQWFDPEPASIPTQLATWLAERGHMVKVLTGFPNYPTGKIYDRYKVKPLQRERSGTIDIVRVPLVPSHSTSAAGRVANFSSFAASAATIGVAALGPVDVAYVYHPPATIGIPAVALKKARGVPFLLHVQDLWPESVVDSGMLRSPRARSVASAVLGRSCQALYRAAGAIAAISPGFRDVLIERGVPADKVSVVYNWADERLAPEPRDPELARELGIDGKFVLMYSGNLGPFQGLDTAIRAAYSLSDLEGCRLVIAGTGIAEAALRRLASDLGANNVTFLGHRPPSEMPRISALADVHLVSLRDSPALARTIPGKVQALLAAGQPLLLVARGDAADLVTRSGAGWVCVPESPAALSTVIRRLSRMPPDARTRAGAAGRSFYKENLSLEAGASTIEQLLGALARDGSRGRPHRHRHDKAA
jgi:colanic acid biosynthesis glycosyl transferase WcaI